MQWSWTKDIKQRRSSNPQYDRTSFPPFDFSCILSRCGSSRCSCRWRCLESLRLAGAMLWMARKPHAMQGFRDGRSTQRALPAGSRTCPSGRIELATIFAFACTFSRASRAAVPVRGGGSTLDALPRTGACLELEQHAYQLSKSASLLADRPLHHGGWKVVRAIHDRINAVLAAAVSSGYPRAVQVLHSARMDTDGFRAFRRFDWTDAGYLDLSTRAGHLATHSAPAACHAQQRRIATRTCRK